MIKNFYFIFLLSLLLSPLQAEDKNHLKKEKEQFEQLCKLHPNDHKALLYLGHLYTDSGEYAKAFACYKCILDRFGPSSDLYNSLGGTLQLSDPSRWKESLSYYEKAITLDPTYPGAYNNIAVLYRQFREWKKAAEYYEKCAKLMPSAQVYRDLGNVYIDLKEWKKSTDAFNRSLEIDPTDAKTYTSFGILYFVLGDRKKAIKCFEKALDFNPEDEAATSYLYVEYRRLCLFDKAQKLESKLDDMTKEALRQGRLCEETPFHHLLRSSDPLENLAISKAWASDLQGSLRHAPYQHKMVPKKKLKIGYLSADFFDHATMHLMAGLFRLHDKSKFDIIVYSHSLNDNSLYRSELIKNCNCFVDINDISDEEAAALIYKDGIDILVDLKGLTQHSRLSIAMYHPAPLQMTYLGYPGTSGADCFDYVITDKIVCPPEHQPYYTEKFLYIDPCYQVNDDHQKISPKKITRADVGLPQDGVVFACFNNPQKIDSQVFDVWMRLLKENPKSVLWLFVLEGDEKLFADILGQRALSKGVEKDRIHFAKKVPKDEHLKRLQLADIAVDTRLYNGHTTTSDALWAGVPVVGLKGSYFPSLVSSSLLTAIEMEELIADSLESYYEKANLLAKNPEKLRAIRKKIEENKHKAPLFNTLKFTRQLEALYERCYQTKFSHQKV